MARTEVGGRQIKDGSVQRDDLDVGTTGQAVIRKLVQGTGISLSSTGTDAGTGDVTVNATGGGTLYDTKGDILIATGADAAAKVAVGTEFLDSLVPDTSASTGVAWGRPRRSDRPTGVLYETTSRDIGGGTGNRTLTSGRVAVTAIDLPSGLLIASISFCSGSTAATSPTNQLFGLYDSSRALLRSSNNDTTTAWAASTVKTLNLTSSFTTTYSGLHYLAVMVTASTVPTLAGTSVIAGIASLAPILCGFADTGRTTSLPNPMAAITGDANFLYAGVS